ncbi:MAG: FHA domain-containing protein [Clostridiales bacterium]|jgi:hypothetical protein|nr:FHA domain-containing protein [Clostridiales bacterium]
MQKLIDSNKIQVDYDFSGSSNFLIISMQNGREIVNYQVQMLSNNKMQNFLQVRKVQINNAAQLYYDITNKATLSQIIKNEKVSKALMFKLLNSILSAMAEAEEYQLEDQGIVLDKKYIYMESAKSKPMFVFLPFYRGSLGIKIIGDFVLDLKRSDVLSPECDRDAKTIVEASYSFDASLEKLAKLIEGLSAALETFSGNDVSNKINRAFGLDQDAYENPFDSIRGPQKDDKEGHDEFFDYFKLTGEETYGPKFNDDIDLSSDVYGFNQEYSNSFNKMGTNDFFNFNDTSQSTQQRAPQEQSHEAPEPVKEPIGGNPFAVKEMFDFTDEPKDVDGPKDVLKQEVKPPTDVDYNIGSQKMTEEDAIRDLREQIFGANAKERKEAQLKRIQEQYGEGFKKNQDPYGDDLGKADSQINLVSSLLKPDENKVSGYHKIDDEEERQALERMKQIEGMAKSPFQQQPAEVNDDTEFIDMESDFIKMREQQYASYLSGKSLKGGKNSKPAKTKPAKDDEGLIESPRHKNSDYDDEFDNYEEVPIPKRNLIIFALGVVGIFVLIVALMFVFDIFQRPDGGPNYMNIAISVATVCMALYIMYRALLEPKEAGYADDDGYNDDEKVAKPKKNKKDGFEPPIRPGKEISNKQPAAKPSKKSLKDNRDITDDLDDTVFVSEKNMPYLTTEVDGVVQKIYLNKPVFVLGRFVGKVDFICQSNKVGKVHAEVINRDGIFFVNDLESKNGTYINSYKNRLKPNIDYPLDEGDVIILADVEFTIHF